MSDAITQTTAKRPLAVGRLKGRLLQASVLAGGLVVLALLWAGLLYHLHLRERTIAHQAERDVVNLSVAMEQQVERLVANVDQVLRFVQDDFAKDPDAFDFAVWTRRATSLDTIATQISMFGETGELIAARTPFAPGMPRFNVRDRPYFQALSTRPDLGLYIDRTVRGRITGRTVLQLARRLNSLDGGFAGVLVVSLDADYLARQFMAIDVGARGSVTLFGRDGYIRARAPAAEGMYDRDARTVATGSGLFENLARAPNGSFETTSVYDGVQRFYGYRSVGSHPLVVLVGKSSEEALASFAAERTRACAAGLATTLVILTVLLLLVRELEQRRRRETLLRQAHRDIAASEAAVRETNRLHGTAERVARVGHWHWLPAEDVVRWSDELYRIYAVNPREFTPAFATFGPMFHPDDRERVAAWLRSELEAGDGSDCEHRIVARTGEVKTILARNLIERDAGGAVVSMVGVVFDVTEQRLAEAALAETTALLAGTLDSMDQGLIMVESGGTVQVVNRRAIEMLELPPDFVASRPSYRSLRAHARRAARWGELVDDTPHWVAGGEAGTPDMRSERRNADGAVLEVRTIPTTGGGIVQTFTDITERRRAEERYRLLAENASDLIVLKPTLMGRRSYVSPASRAVVGWEPEELAAMPTDQYVHPDDLPRVAAEYASLTEASPQVVSEHRVRHKAGHYVWVETVFQVTRAGMPDEAVVLTARDVTARRAADMALRESESLHRVLAEKTSDIIARLDLDGTLRYLSPVVDDVLGYPAESIIGRLVTDFIDPDDVEDVRREFRALVAAGPGARANFEYRARHRDGRTVWLEVNPTVLFDEATGQPTGYIDVARDVTARKAVEAELTAAREQTEFARRQAELASQAKTDFLASMSHEIRTPLNSIIGYTDLLLDDEALSERQRGQADRIRSSGSALLIVVNDILDFSKIEAGEIDLDPSPFRLASLVDTTVSIVRGLGEGKGLAIAVEVDPGLPAELLGDENRLRQILLNLLNNAVKFTPHGRVTLSVRRDRGPRAIRFAVIDTGIGIPHEKQGRLFQRFSQVDGSIRREFGGTGLGLAISKSLVGLMQGTIGVDSVPGQGSTFWFTVSLPEAVEPAAEPVAEADQGTVRSARILLVEDLPINQDLARAVLERAGHAVDVAADGIEAIAAVTAKAYDLILMDVQMPVMDGVTATRRIRAMAPPLSDIPIVAMTANVLPAQVAAFRAAGMNDHVGKPFRRAELYAAIARWTRAPAPAAGPSEPAFAFAFDQEAYDALVDLMGADRMAHLLDQLADQIDERLGDARLRPDAPGDLARDAHTLVSSAGMLGFSELSGLCAELEAACLAGSDLGGLIDSVRRARHSTLARIETLRAA